MPIRAAADAPLLVTAHLDAESFAVLDDLRRRHFPITLNKVPAHISLFHHLPGAECDGVRSTIQAICADLGPIELMPLGPKLLGKGVALAYVADELTALHTRLAEAWREWLTPQDRQPFKAHVTIQNRVAPAEAKALFASLDGWSGPPCRVEGLDLWCYLGGPWEAIASIAFGRELRVASAHPAAARIRSGEA